MEAYMKANQMVSALHRVMCLDLYWNVCFTDLLHLIPEAQACADECAQIITFEKNNINYYNARYSNL